MYPGVVPVTSGWQPSPPGGAAAPPPGAAPPAPPAGPISLIERPRIRDQGELGCCVSIAIVGALELLVRRGRVLPELSPLFHYWQARVDHSVAAPLSILTGLQAAAQHGVCRQALHPHPLTVQGAMIPPSPAAQDDAAALAAARFDPVTGVRLSRYTFARLPDHRRHHHIRQALAAAQPVVLGFWLTPGYAAITPQRPVHSRDLEPVQRVGHAVLVVADHPARGLRIVDAAGPRFGARGTWWLPHDLLDQSALVQECWSLQRRA